MRKVLGLMIAVTTVIYLGLSAQSDEEIIVLGEVFSVSGNNVDLLRKGQDVGQTH